MVDFDMADLRKAVQDLHHQLTDGPSEALGMVLAKLDELAGRQKKRDAGLHKALMMVSTQLKTVLDQQQGALVGTAALLADAHQRPVAKSQESPIRSIRTMAQDAHGTRRSARPATTRLGGTPEGHPTAEGHRGGVWSEGRARDHVPRRDGSPVAPGGRDYQRGASALEKI